MHIVGYADPWSVAPGETVGIVGESGCGKTMAAMSIIRLLPGPPGRIVGGSIKLDAKDLTQLAESEMRDIRGNEISMIFQEPMTSLNPVYTVGDQISEAVQLHQNVGGRKAGERAVEMMRLVGIPSPEKRVRDYPHQMSGGMRQRVMIAMALALEPAVLIADEPTTALDVTTQAQILKLLRELQERYRLAVMFITHDFGVVSEIADEIAVMRHGELVEHGPAGRVLGQPAHAYTKQLLAAVPSLVLGPGCDCGAQCTDEGTYRPGISRGDHRNLPAAYRQLEASAAPAAAFQHAGDAAHRSSLAHRGRAQDNCER